MRKITFTKDSYSDYLSWLETDRKIFIRLSNLIRETARTPQEGIGNPEPLKHEMSGYWSRRINQEHRLVYSFTEDSIEIVSCKYHYK